MSQSRAKREVMITMTKVKPGSCSKKARHHGEKQQAKADDSKNSSTGNKVNLAEMLKGFI